MNPFLNPTVATPQPDARWRDSPRRMPACRPTAPGNAASAAPTHAELVASTTRETITVSPPDTSTPPAAGNYTPTADGVCLGDAGHGPQAPLQRAKQTPAGMQYRADPPRCTSRSVGMRTDLFRRAGRYFGNLTLAGCLLIPGFAIAVDINIATAQELQQVKGIGPKMAQVIVEERERGGRFESMTDVSERVKGVGPKKAASFQAAGLTVGAAQTMAGPDAKAGAPAAGKPRRGR